MDKATINGLIETRMQQMQAQQEQLVEAWKPYLKGIDKYLESTQSRTMDDHERRNVAQCLENALVESGIKSRMRLFEATTEDNIAFLGIQLPVIAALLPSLILNDIATIQALDRRIGAVFYLDIKYGTTKGSVTAGDTMMSAKTGHDRTTAGRRFASTMVADEVLSGSASQSSGGTITGTLGFYPGVDITTAGRVVIRDANGTIVGQNLVVGTYSGTGITAALSIINSTDGTYSFVLAADTDSDGLTIDYDYQYDLPFDASHPNVMTGVPEADISVTQETITAIDFPIRSKYSVGASIDLQKAHGINLESEIVKFLGGEVRFTMDHYGVDLIDDAALYGNYVNNVLQSPADAITAWDAQVQSGQEWLWKKHEIKDRFEEGNNNIITKTLRGLASFIVAGNNVARVIKQLPDFKGVANLNKTPPTGPIKIGTLDNRTIIQDPLMRTKYVNGANLTGPNRYIMGWKGDSFLQAGFVFAPYIPLFATPTLITNDLFAQKGFLSAAGYKVINNGMFCYGSITNLGT